MGIKTANITDASNIPTNEVIGILEKIKFHTTLAYFIINKLKPNTDIEQKPYYPYSTPNSVFHKLPTMVYQNGKSSFWQCQG